MTNSPIESALGGLKRISSVEVSPDSHHFLVLTQLHRWMAEVAGSVVQGVVVDYGCGGQPYRQLFAPNTKRYIGADVAAAAGVTLDLQFGPGEPLALPDQSADTILATQTLEHVYDFELYLRDCYRLLKKGGYLVISVPMQWRHHEVPYDFWRFTRYGLTRKLTDTGFQIENIERCGGVYSLLATIYLNHRAERATLNHRVARLVNRFALWMDKRTDDDDDTLLWMCIAKRP
jgi:SAM-dependent methyltransferase